MRPTFTMFVTRTRRTIAAAAVVAAMLSAGMSAHAQTRESDRDSQPLPAAEKLSSGDSKGGPDSGVGMNGDTLPVSTGDGRHAVYIIGVEGKPGAMTVHLDGLPMQIFFDVVNIDVDFSDGDHFLAVLQVNVAGNVDVTTGDGKNQMLLGLPPYDPNLIWGNLSVAVGDGENEIKIEESWVVGNATVGSGIGDNTFVMGQAGSPSDLGAVVLGDLVVGTGSGADRIEIAKCWIDGNTAINTGGGNDLVILGTHYAPGSPIAGNVFNGNLTIATAQGFDSIGLTDNIVGGATLITMSQDDDALLVGDAPAFPPNHFVGAFEAHGGSGTDGYFNDPGNVYDSSILFQGFE